MLCETKQLLLETQVGDECCAQNHDDEARCELPEPRAPPQLLLFQLFDLLLEQLCFGLVRAPQLRELTLEFEPRRGELRLRNSLKLRELGRGGQLEFVEPMLVRHPD